MEFNERLLQAIKNDDVKEFESCMGFTHCGTIRLGRFPTLSVMYMYDANKLLRAYEKSFLKSGTWQDIGEPMELSAKFRSIAGKCLRLYLTETVSPAEMLLLLNRNYKLQKVFPQSRAAAPVRQRLKDIYFIRWGLRAEFVRNKIILQRRPMTRVEKLRWFTGAVCVLLCVAMVVSMPFVINVFSPFIADGQGVVNVNKWEQIKFGSNKAYALTKDVTVKADYFVKELNCVLRGNGHTVTVEGNGVFGDINGKLSDIVFNTNGSPVAQSITDSAEVDGVTVNATVNVSANKAMGFLANNNYGIITNVVVNATGRLAALEQEVNEDEQEQVNSYNCGGIVAFNGATINDCTVNFNNFSLQGQLSADAAFGGIAGKNDDSIEGCKTSGVISANTFDVAGICVENNRWISTCTNAANITQQTELTGWNPLAAGVVINNFLVVDQCENTGSISSVSTAPALSEGTPCAYAAGIAYQSVGHGSLAYVQFCTNSGDISASAQHINANAAGICNSSNGYISVCVNSGKVNAKCAILAEVAGIVGVSYGYAYHSVNRGQIVAESQQEARVGGIVGTSYLETVECYSAGNIEVTGDVCFVGGILGYSMYYIAVNALYCGLVESSIAECEITVTSTAPNKRSAVGGIVGCMQNVYVESHYIGGHVGESFFIGKLQTSAGVYTGAIAGTLGENLYNTSKSIEEQLKQVNLSEEKRKELLKQLDLHDNVYSNDCGASLAYGAVFGSDGTANVYADVCAEKATRSQIINDAIYQDILDKIFADLNHSE